MSSLFNAAANVIEMDKVDVKQVVMPSIIEAAWVMFKADDDDFSMDLMDKFDDIEFSGNWMVASTKTYNNVVKLAKKENMRLEKR